MQNDIELSIATMFRDATQNGMVLELRTEADWERFNDIKETARQSHKDELQSFENDRAELVDAAMKEIIDNAGALTFEHPTPFGTDRFDPTAIERQATTQVENAHQGRLLKICTDETEAYNTLRDDIHSREGARDMAREAFAVSADRRQGGERRMPSIKR